MAFMVVPSELAVPSPDASTLVPAYMGLLDDATSSAVLDTTARTSQRGAMPWVALLLRSFFGRVWPLLSCSPCGAPLLSGVRANRTGDLSRYSRAS